MRGDCAGFAGNGEVETPCLDALAARGTVLEKHFAPFPKCVPARCSMHTGRYPHTEGLRTVMPENHLPGGEPTLGKFLGEQGYETAILGLNHVWREEDFYGSGESKNTRSAGVVDYTSFTGRDLPAILERSHAYPAGACRPTEELEALQSVGHRGRVEGTADGFIDENRADQACLYLREIRDPRKPFFLQLNLSKPHPPYGIHEPFYSQYDPAAITPFPYALPKNAPLPLRAQRQYRLGNEVPEAALREIQAVYFGMISFIDAQVGKVLDTLKACGLEENTLVLFCSDHGDYAGQYGLPEKWDASLQDCLLHVPALLAGPGIPAGNRVTGLTEMVDTPATVLDYLGLEKPDGWHWHGSSLLPVIHGAPAREAVFASGGHEAPMRERFNTPAWQEKDGRRVKATLGKQLTYRECPDAMARCKMVRTGDWKLVVRETGGNELYDMRKDPREMKNLYENSHYERVILDLQQRIIEWTLRTDPDRPRIGTVGA